MTITTETTLADGREVSIDYSVTDWGCPSNGWDEPGWGAEVEIAGIFDETGADIRRELDEDELAKIEANLCESAYNDGPDDDGGDPYDD